MFHKHKTMQNKEELNDESVTTEENKTLQENIPSQTLFSLLEDKNRIINVLKKQLENQKLQIKFYMRKYLNNSNLIEFSKSCSPETIEDNIPLVLAMGNFRNHLGMKSKIYQLYEEVNELYRISTNNLRNQEFVLRKFFTHLCLLYSNNSNCTINSTHLIEILNDPRQITLMNNLLDTTLDLKRILEHFRVSSERLITIEDERNEIIHQTLALSPNDKRNFNVAINTKMENLQLRKELEEIKERDKESLKECNPIDKQLMELQNQIETFFATDETSNICNMLNNLNEEAKCLLSSTRKNLHQEKKNSDNSAKKFFRKIASDSERHTIRVEYAQKEVKETKSIFHAEFYNTNESDNDVKFYSTEKQNIFNGNEYKKDIWTQEVYDKTFVKNRGNLLKEYQGLLQQNKIKDENIHNLKNLSKNLTDKINFMQVIIERQNEQLQQQKILTRCLVKMFEEKNNNNPTHIYQSITHLRQNKTLTNSYENTNREETKHITLSDSNISRVSQRLYFGNQNSFANNENECNKFRKIPSAPGVFHKNQKKIALLKSPTKTGGLPWKTLHCKKLPSENGLEEYELFRDVSNESIPVICPPIKRKATKNHKRNLNNKNITETENNILKGKEYIVEKEMEITDPLNESYCIPFEKI